jgi:hypothetical protein
VVLVVIVIAAIVVVAAIVLVAMGRGDGLSVERNDYLQLDLGPVSATDVALLRPPTGLWGYNMQATDEAMEQIAESIRERDVRIVALEQLVTDLSREPAQPLSSPYVSARHRRAALDPVPAEPYPVGPDRYPVGPDRYPAGPDRYPAGPDRYPAGPDRYPAGPDRYPAGPDRYPVGPDPYQAENEPYRGAPEPSPAAAWPEEPGAPADDALSAPPEQSHD